MDVLLAAGPLDEFPKPRVNAALIAIKPSMAWRRVIGSLKS